MIRFRQSFLVLALAAGISGCAGCSSSAASDALPDGVQCASRQSASDAQGAQAALAGAASGSCVVLDGASFTGPFVVPAGVTLTAKKSARASIAGGAGSDPAVTLGEGAALAGIDVGSTSGVGVAVRTGTATVSDVTVTAARSAALAVLCKGATCGPGSVSLVNVSLQKSGLGLWVSGATVTMTGGRSGDHTGQSLTSAAGIVAQDGAHLTLDGVTVEKNDGVGVLIDGAATTAWIKGSTVSDNGERGVWAQRVAGTLDAPAVRIEQSNLVRNKIVGLGGVEARGIIIVGGRVAETIAAPVVTDLATTEQVGDGIGIFSGSTDFKIDGSLVEANARAAGLVDKGSKNGIIIVGGTVSAGASGLKFVVQNTPDGVVQVPDAAKSASTAVLGVSAPTLGLPAVL